MASIRVFFVTYDDPAALEVAVSSALSRSHARGAQAEFFVINNHSNFRLHPSLARHVRVIHNSARPDFSTGHLSRSWNQCILHGFVDPVEPACNMLVMSQDDVEFRDDWLARLLDLHSSGLSFVQSGWGDMVMSMTPDCVREVGMWDERFCNIGHQEEDYFYRCAVALRGRCSINDHWHRRLHNPMWPDEASSQIAYRNAPDGGYFHERNLSSMRHHDVSMSVLEHKWGWRRWPGWDMPEEDRVAVSVKSPMCPTYMYYPYFERKLPDQAVKGYLPTKPWTPPEPRV